MADNYHLTHNADSEQWDVKKEGASRASATFDKHSKALARGRELAANSSVSLILHDESGKVTGSEKPEITKPGIIGKVGRAIRAPFTR